MSPCYPFNIRSEGQSQGSQTAKYIEGDRVAGVSYVLYRVPSLRLQTF